MRPIKRKEFVSNAMKSLGGEGSINRLQDFLKKQFAQDQVNFSQNLSALREAFNAPAFRAAYPELTDRPRSSVLWGAFTSVGESRLDKVLKEVESEAYVPSYSYKNLGAQCARFFSSLAPAITGKPGLSFLFPAMMLTLFAESVQAESAEFDMDSYPLASGSFSARPGAAYLPANGEVVTAWTDQEVIWQQPIAAEAPHGPSAPAKQIVNATQVAVNAGYSPAEAHVDEPRLAALSAGGYVLGFQMNFDRNSKKFLAQEFDSNYQAIGGLVDLGITGRLLDLVASPNGNVVANWDASKSCFRIYDSSLSAVSSTQSLGSVSGFPSVAVAADNQIVMSHSKGAVTAKRYSSTGAALSGELPVSQFDGESCSSATVASLSNGKFVTAYVLERYSPSQNWEVYHQQLNAGNEFVFGSPQLAPVATAGDQANPVVKVIDDGRYAVAWKTAGIKVRFFNANNSAASEEIAVSQSAGNTVSHTVVPVGNKTLAVFWTRYYNGVVYKHGRFLDIPELAVSAAAPPLAPSSSSSTGGAEIGSTGGSYQGENSSSTGGVAILPPENEDDVPPVGDDNPVDKGGSQPVDPILLGSAIGGAGAAMAIFAVLYTYKQRQQMQADEGPKSVDLVIHKNGKGPEQGKPQALPAVYAALGKQQLGVPGGESKEGEGNTADLIQMMDGTTVTGRGGQGPSPVETCEPLETIPAPHVVAERPTNRVTPGVSVPPTTSSLSSLSSLSLSSSSVEALFGRGPDTDPRVEEERTEGEQSFVEPDLSGDEHESSTNSQPGM